MIKNKFNLTIPRSHVLALKSMGYSESISVSDYIIKLLEKDKKFLFWLDKISISENND